MHGMNGKYFAFRSPIPLPLHGFRECDANGDVGAIAANGGTLASDTTPIMRGAAGLISQEISWAAGNVDPIICQVPLPEDFDGKENVQVDLGVYSGTTDAASFVISTSWDGGATKTATASDAATKSATIHTISAVIPASDIPDNATFVTVMLTPPAHATNAIQLTNARMGYLPKAA